MEWWFHLSKGAKGRATDSPCFSWFMCITDIISAHTLLVFLHIFNFSLEGILNRPLIQCRNYEYTNYLIVYRILWASPKSCPCCTCFDNSISFIKWWPSRCFVLFNPCITNEDIFAIKIWKTQWQFLYILQATHKSKCLAWVLELLPANINHSERVVDTGWEEFENSN